MDIGGLSEIEKIIYDMTENGMASNEIAAQLGYSNSHTNFLKRKVYAKLGSNPPKANKLVGTYVKGFYIKDIKWESKHTYAYVVCPYCKKEKWIRLDQIKDKRIISCGCYSAQYTKKQAMDLSGKVFNRLKAIKPTDDRAENGSVIWECKCECGNVCYVSSAELLKGSVGSCGCLGKENSVKQGKINGRNLVEKYVLEGTNVNNLTSKTPLTNTSGVKGVCWDKSKGKWRAQITFKGKNYHLGYYGRIEDAADARACAEENMFGDFLKWFAEQFPERWEKMQAGRKVNDKLE